LKRAMIDLVDYNHVHGFGSDIGKELFEGGAVD
jgi:hypothetical protein